MVELYDQKKLVKIIDAIYGQLKKKSDKRIKKLRKERDIIKKR